MNTRFLPSLIIGLTLGLTFLTPAQAAISKISVTVRSESLPDKKGNSKDDKDKPKVEMDQKKLVATVKNASQEAATGLQINFYYLGHASGSSDIKIIQKDTKKKDLAAGEQAVVESKILTASFTPASMTKPKKDSDERPERVKASGDKFSGWAVQVIAGEELVGEAYSSPAMKVALGTDGASAAKP